MESWTRDLPDIQGTLETLQQQLRELRRKATSAREEAAGLQQTNAVLSDQLKTRDKKISELEKERDQWKDKAQRNSLCPKPKSPFDISDLEAPRVNEGGFSVLSKEHPGYCDVWANSTTKDDGQKLRLLYESLAESRVKPEILRKHDWFVRPHASQDEADKKDSADAMDVDENAAGTKQEAKQLSSPSSPPIHPDRTANFERTVTSEDEDEPYGTGKADAESPYRRKYSDPSDPGRDSLDDSIFGRYATGSKRPALFHEGSNLRRKSVCVHCWQTRAFCDSSSRCKPCRNDNVKCVRKLCELALSCRNPRCPCLHPGEWNEDNPDWNVETGPMPKVRKALKMEDRMLARADCYRPTGRDPRR